MLLLFLRSVKKESDGHELAFSLNMKCEAPLNEVHEAMKVVCLE